MSDFASLKSTLKRGALVAAANWPVIAIQFLAEAVFKVLLGVPIVGGILLVAALLGRSLQEMLGGSAREMVATIIDALADHPVALGSFLLALGVVVLGGSVFTFLVKGGTVSVLVRGSDVAGAVERPPLRMGALRRASAFSVDQFTEGCARLFRRYLRLGLLLLAAYAASVGAYLASLALAYRLAESGQLIVRWSVVVALASTVLVAWIALVNLLYLLTQMVTAAEDCSVRSAMGRVAAFVGRKRRQVALVFGVLLVLVTLATIASMLATAGLGLVSFVPLVGLAVLPLQAAAWLVRGLMFQYLGLTALGAYVSLYRPADTASAGDAHPTWVRTAS